MGILQIVMVALGLSMDAFAVTVAKSISCKQFTMHHSIMMAFWCGLLQGLMPLIGWHAGSHFEDAIHAYDHWVAFVLLLFVGGKMLLECSDEKRERGSDDMRLRAVLLLALATSIDALVIGISFSVLDVPILPASALITVITFTVCFIGGQIGRFSGKHIQKSANILGGILLICMGCKIVFDHIG